MHICVCSRTKEQAQTRLHCHMSECACLRAYMLVVCILRPCTHASRPVCIWPCVPGRLLIYSSVDRKLKVSVRMEDARRFILSRFRAFRTVTAETPKPYMQLEPKPETLNPSMHADEVGPMFDLAKPVAAYSIKRCGTCSFVYIPCTTQNIKLPILRF